MKNYKSILLVFLTVLLLGSCEKEYVAPDTLADVAMIQGQSPSLMWARNIGEEFTLRDASQGTLSHEWIIEEGNKFLKSGFSDDDSLELFIDTEKGLKSTDFTVHVQLNKQGINTIRLHNTYPEKVTWYRTTDTIESVKQGDVWVLDAAFEVDVYEPIQPALKVFKDGMEIMYVRSGVEILPQEEWDTLTIEAGSQLQFVDVTTVGRPNGRTWTLPGTNQSTNDSVATANYYSLGAYTASFTGRRSYPLPVGSTSTDLPLIIKVVQSTRPFVQVGAEILEDGTIAVSTSGDIVDFYQLEEYFNVHINNGDYSADASINRVYKNPEQSTQFIIEISETLYADDEVTLTYNDDQMVSVDERVFLPFENIVVTPYLSESVVDADIFGFEGVEEDNRDGLLGWWAQEAMTNDNATPLVYSRSTTEFVSGISSVQFLADFDEYPVPYSAPADNFKLHGGNLTEALPAGAYYVEAWVKVIDATINTFKISALPDYVNANLELDLARKGQWVKVSRVINHAENDITKFNLVVDLTDASGVQHLYVDDVKIIPVVIRPE